MYKSQEGGCDGDKCSCVLLFRFEDRSFHLHNITRMQSEQAKNTKLLLLNEITWFCMEHFICRQQIIGKYFGDKKAILDTCDLCDVCQREELQNQVKDCTQDAKDILECMTAVKVKVKVR